MSLADHIRDLALLGYIIGIILVLLGGTVLMIILFRNKDDGFQPIGQAELPPKYVSPFRQKRIMRDE